MHAVFPVPSAYEPVGHAVQLPAPTPEYVPAAQFEHDVLPASAYVPALHFVHDPLANLYPALHPFDLHKLLTVLLLELHVGVAHPVDPVIAVHAVQLPDAVVPAVLVFPTPHTVQALAPDPLYVPATHFVQLVAPARL